MMGLDEEELIFVVNLKLPFVLGRGRLQHRLFTDKLTMVRTVGDTEETDVEFRLPFDVHAVINVFLSPLLD
jgi:hypothetical protein